MAVVKEADIKKMIPAWLGFLPWMIASIIYCFFSRKPGDKLGASSRMERHCKLAFRQTDLMNQSGQTARRDLTESRLHLPRVYLLQ
jgi:hypothetical protein